MLNPISQWSPGPKHDITFARHRAETVLETIETPRLKRFHASFATLHEHPQIVSFALRFDLTEHRDV